jgi:hypothetical protein
VTVVEDVARTLPTPLLMVKEVGVPPDRVQASVEDWPDVIEAGVAVKELITGAGGVTVTVTDRVTVPPLLEAVSI